MRNHKLFWQSSYDRGLDIFLRLWPKILEKFPDATLEITYGWDLFDVGYADNPERHNWKSRVNNMMKQTGITHHGRVGQDKLRELHKECGIWAYPTWFSETNCIGALETQRDGLVPVVMNVAALKETVGSGFKIDGDIYETEVQKKWLEALFKVMGDEKLWEEESKKAKEWAKNYSWDKIASEWAKYFNG